MADFLIANYSKLLLTVCDIHNSARGHKGSDRFYVQVWLNIENFL